MEHSTPAQRLNPSVYVMPLTKSTMENIAWDGTSFADADELLARLLLLSGCDSDRSDSLQDHAPRSRWTTLLQSVNRREVRQL
jgi:hypothetical protein